MSMSGSNATSPRMRSEALYVTSFPTRSYRRPIMAARALKLLGFHTSIVEGWNSVGAMKPASLLTSYANFLPPPLNWLSKDLVYELGVFKIISSMSPMFSINLNVVGSIGSRLALKDKPLILDIQDFTIQDDHTIPFYDKKTLEVSAPDLVIFASEPIKLLVEKKYPKLLKRTAYVPFGIDLTTFDKYYSNADPMFFRSHYSIRNSFLLVYSGAAYLWGNREGQGINLLLEAVKIVVKELPDVKLILQGAAKPASTIFLKIWSWIRSLGLEGSVIMLPPMPPYAHLRMSMLKAADVLVSPIGDILGTIYATQQKLFEYMAASRPIAMVATPGRLSVVNEECAYIAYRRDPVDFAAAITTALSDKSEARDKSRHARRLVEQ